jgi:chromosome segregation ATPase
MKDLESDTSDKLSERYAKVLEEVEKLNKEMEVYTRYDILTDADAKAKATLEEQIASLLSEKNKIEQNLTEAQLQRAESMVGETETDKILREAAEQKAAYQAEIDDYKNKLEEQKSLLETYRAQESEMVEKYNFLDTKSSEAKYRELLKQLEEYRDERDAIVKEMDYISQNITEQQLQEAIIR